MTRRCWDCGETKTLQLFPLNAGGALGFAHQCKTCRRKDEKARRDANPAARRARHRAASARWERANRAKRRAYAAVRAALASGRLQKPDVCEGCQEGRPLQAHHDDYSAPLVVRWLCAGCHAEVHSEERRAAA